MSRRIKYGALASLSDADLSAKLNATGSREYFGAFYLRYLPYMYGFLLKKVTKSEDAQELVASLAGVLADKAVTEKPSDLKSWLVDELWAYSVKKYGGKADEHGGLALEQAVLARKIGAGDKQAREYLAEKGPMLDQLQKESIKLFLVNGESYEEIAEKTGFLTGDVRRYVESGLKEIAGVRDVDMPAAPDFALVRYVRGERRGVAARNMELAAMTDPFISDVVDGYERWGSDPHKTLTVLGKNISEEFFGKAGNRGLLSVVILALIAIVAAAFIYFYMRNVNIDAREANWNEGPVSTVQVTSEGSTDSRNAITEVRENSGAEKSVESVKEEVGAVPENNAGQAVADPQEQVVPTQQSAPESGPAISTTSSANSGEMIFSVQQVKEQDSGKMYYPALPKVGKKKYNEYLQRAITLPGDGSKGEVTLTFRVNKYGRPSGIRITGFLSQEAHREAIRLLDSGPEWTPTDETVTVTISFR